MLATYLIRTFSVASVALPLLLASLSLAASATTGLSHQPAKPRSVPVVLALAATGSAPADTTTSATPAAQQVVQLKGLVLSSDGRPCAGASVFPAGAPRQLVVTDAKGAFTLPVPAGTALSLQVEYFGVGSSRVAVDKPTDEPLRITLGK
ncbi:hypothetical protein E4631_19020 [Hymenobacter sp. UV11]|uniref:carboxypeptidase regulatory-like domain-containing protein n=1 Tax=Hymenobacter sp. UV11 TaxID=1849735 RepID=UPI00105C4D8D|nr:carboxypeptidase regulatory-like domain-containing protein [Hymenobacter sp. UV11]TDN36502.1 hypothetical protein A8B98_09120 [Hymenobacter sp. UV11]TFZ64606.1 hypothetical protein E4631_19020 [Hymenobacter sp. UV11]